MSDKTLTKADIVDAIYEKTNRPRSEVKTIVDSMIELMKRAIQ
ncbi:hypothetical protein JCM14635_06010 [Megalodesulfovibrio paquesii]